MGLLDRLFGRRDRQRSRAAVPAATRCGGRRTAGELPDEQAVERYRYLLRTAPPEQIEQAHAEAFAQLTPISASRCSPSWRPRSRPGNARGPTTPRRCPRGHPCRDAAARDARAGVRRLRAGLRRGGYGRVEGGYGRRYGGRRAGMGSMIGGSLLGTIGGLVIGTAVADALFDTGMGDGGLFGGGDEEAYAEGYQDGGAQARRRRLRRRRRATSGAGDFGGGDFGGGDF